MKIAPNRQYLCLHRAHIRDHGLFVNETLDKVDWSQAGRIGKVVGIFAAVIVAQILIKGILDTINLLPVVPGLLELLGVVVVGQWSWKNLTTSEKRTALVNRVQTIRSEYLG